MGKKKMILLGGYLAALLLILHQIWFWLRLGQVGFPVACGLLCLFGLLSILPMVGALVGDGPWKNRMQAAGNVWLGYYLYAAAFLFALFILRLVLRLLGHPAETISPEIARIFLLTACILTIGVNLYGYFMAHRIVITEYTYRFPDGQTEAKAGAFRIAVLADMHLGVNSRLSFVQKLVEKVNQVDADLILFAGDMFSSTYEGLSTPEEYISILQKMKAKQGKYAVFGNHDMNESLLAGISMTTREGAKPDPNMGKFMESMGFQLLRDEVVPFYFDNGEDKVWLVGRRDGKKPDTEDGLRMSVEEIMKGLPENEPILVLEHEPMELKQLAEYGADLIVSGHTHAGQIIPGTWLVKLLNENDYGEKWVTGENGNRALSIVSSGSGYYGPPIRVGTKTEVVQINILFGEEAK